MFSEKKKIFETSFLFRGLSFYGAGCTVSRQQDLENFPEKQLGNFLVQYTDRIDDFLCVSVTIVDDMLTTLPQICGIVLYICMKVRNNMYFNGAIWRKINSGHNCYQSIGITLPLDC
jgi:hypothetical protein